MRQCLRESIMSRIHLLAQKEKHIYVDYKLKLLSLLNGVDWFLSTLYNESLYARPISEKLY